MRTLMDKALWARFGEAEATAPHVIQWLSDNAPQFTATASVLYAHELGLVPITTPAYSPDADDRFRRIWSEFVGRMMSEMEPWDEDEDLRESVVDLLARHLLAGLRGAFVRRVVTVKWNEGDDPPISQTQEADSDSASQVPKLADAGSIPGARSTANPRGSIARFPSTCRCVGASKSESARAVFGESRHLVPGRTAFLRCAGSLRSASMWTADVPRSTTANPN